MTRILSILIIICLALLSSCTSFHNIEKRKYRDGFYVDNFSISNKLIGPVVRKRRCELPLDRVPSLSIPLQEVKHSLLQQDLIKRNNSIPILTNEVKQIDRTTIQHKNTRNTFLHDSIPNKKHGNKVLTKDQAVAKANSSADWGHDFLIYGAILFGLLLPVSIILLFRARIILRKNDIDDETLKRRTRRLLLLDLLFLVLWFLFLTSF